VGSVAYASSFEYAICVIPAAEVGGLGLLFYIRLGTTVCVEMDLIYVGTTF
jgi:hypothetical protein